MVFSVESWGLLKAVFSNCVLSALRLDISRFLRCFSAQYLYKNTTGFLSARGSLVVLLLRPSSARRICFSCQRCEIIGCESFDLNHLSTWIQWENCVQFVTILHCNSWSTKKLQLWKPWETPKLYILSKQMLTWHTGCFYSLCTKRCVMRQDVSEWRRNTVGRFLLQTHRRTEDSLTKPSADEKRKRLAQGRSVLAGFNCKEIKQRGCWRS